MPTTTDEFLWWGVSILSLLILKLTCILLYFVRKELKGINETFKAITDELKKVHKNYHNIYTWMVGMAIKFNDSHPKVNPIEPPKWEE